MTLYDISQTITENTPMWPGDPAPRVGRSASIGRGDPCNTTFLEMGAHTATHIDAPLHFIDNGTAVDAIALDALVGPCHVEDLSCLGERREIGIADLQDAGIPDGTRRLIVKTMNSAPARHGESAFRADFTALSDEACAWLAEKGLALVGIDAPSISAFEHPMAGHLALLRANAIILEGLELSGIEPGSYTLYCLPLKIAGADGAPARAVLAR